MPLSVGVFTEHGGSRCPCRLRAVSVASPEGSRGSGGVQLSGQSDAARPLALTDSDVLLTRFLLL
jgi:hypothetical protein